MPRHPRTRLGSEGSGEGHGVVRPGAARCLQGGQNLSGAESGARSLHGRTPPSESLVASEDPRNGDRPADRKWSEPRTSNRSGAGQISRDALIDSAARCPDRSQPSRASWSGSSSGRPLDFSMPTRNRSKWSAGSSARWAPAGGQRWPDLRVEPVPGVARPHDRSGGVHRELRAVVDDGPRGTRSCSGPGAGLLAVVAAGGGAHPVEPGRPGGPGGRS